MAWTGERKFIGEARGTQTMEGEIRTSAEAALAAVAQSTKGKLGLTLRGAKAFRAFDAWMVVVPPSRPESGLRPAPQR